MLHQLEATASLNILAYARYLARLSPPPSSLPLEDYVLAHEVLCEAVQSQASVLRPADLQADSLLLLDDLHVERQFCLATSLPLCRLSLPVNPFQASAALHPANQSKNNSLDFVAVDWSRVHLTDSGRRRPSMASLHSDLGAGEDYVNASWVPGYAGPREFVLSHHPRPGSLAQFWRMVHITRAPLVVCLSIVPQSFWPLDASAPPLRFELSGGGGSGRQLVVWLESEGFTGGYRSARVSLSVIGCDVAAAAVGGGDDVTTVQLIFCPNWPHQSIPVSNCVHLVDMVAKLLPGDGGGGPVVVMDSFGATEAAIFCVLSSLVRQMDLEVRQRDISKGTVTRIIK